MTNEPVKKEKVEEFILTTELIKEIEEKENLGKILKRYERLWFSNLRGIRKSNLTFAMTDDEWLEYIKCKINIHYFAENYCQIKREDGTIGPMKLRDYQKDIIDLYSKNPRSILMASRQTGKCNYFNIKVLVKKSNGISQEYSIGELYYDELKKDRTLTFLEKLKIFLYKILNKLD
ncbi:hypothetical protein M0Q97_02305 [Candidatus Dojkabacteria bacterium]|jgi:hypothetical protein|nr:hypothetical protein [Candidatus Dojkabacteria bacterium]